MFSPSQAQIYELMYFAYLSDMEIRSDLVAGYIRDEDDYTSNFTGALRRNLNCYSQTGIKATSHLLKTTHERRYGCDAAIVITSRSQSKIILFEAKNPRFSQANYCWDYPQTSSGGQSHFSDQIRRQKKYATSFAIFEMFYNDRPIGQGPSKMGSLVSSCIWHADAVSFDHSRPSGTGPWRTSDLVSLISNSEKNIAEVIEAVCRCKEGKPQPIYNIEALELEPPLPETVLIVDLGNSASGGED